MSPGLPRTFGAFFGRFAGLNVVQRDVIPVILDGRSAVVVAPTASGKTEAAVAPLVERWVPPDSDALLVLYVVPTRALVNDLRRRLEAPLAALRVRLAAKTGEVMTLSARESSGILVTTPESLDSLLCRRAALFGALRAVVLDEVHLLDGTYRGDQLRILLSRLESLTPGPLQRVVLSATVADAEGLGQRYAPGATVIRTGEARPIALETAPSREAVVARLRESGRLKALWFCDSRAQVEKVAEELAAVWPRNRVAVHHGSLSQRERHDAEAALREWTWGICVATTTLEVGIDIGDVDAVVLEAPPLTVSAFVQRVGRGGRREDRATAVGLCLGEDDARSFEVLAELAARGELEVVGAPPDLSVCVQQVLSALFGAPSGLPPTQLEAWLEPLASRAVLGAILDHLEREDYVVRARGKLMASTRTMDLGEKGRVHSNIPDGRESQVVDAATGRTLGRSLTGVQAGDTVVFAGAARRVLSIGGGRVVLGGGGGAEPGARPAFARRRERGGFAWLLPEALR